jgi:predicted Fe-Mo cluster-binding NifX family protein
MRLAIPLAEGKLADQVNRCEEFALVDVDPHTGIVRGRRSTAVPPVETAVVPQWLADQGAQVLIVGSMGRREQGLFSDRGIRTILGAPPETPGQLVAAYVAGRLRAGDAVRGP